MIRVLHIEDSMLFQEIVAEELELSEEAFEVRHAATLAEALQILGTWTPDVVLSDLWLPDSEGRDTYHAVRAALAPTTKLVVLTGSDRMLLEEMLGTAPHPVLPKDDVAEIPGLVISLMRS